MARAGGQNELADEGKHRIGSVKLQGKEIGALVEIAVHQIRSPTFENKCPAVTAENGRERTIIGGDVSVDAGADQRCGA